MKIIKKWKAHNKRILYGAIKPDTTQLLTGSPDETIKYKNKLFINILFFNFLIKSNFNCKFIII